MQKDNTKWVGYAVFMKQTNNTWLINSICWEVLSHKGTGGEKLSNSKLIKKNI